MRRYVSRKHASKRGGAPSPPPEFFADTRGIDIAFALAVIIFGGAFLGDHERWAAWWVVVGGSPTGDAAFWWGGVLDAYHGDIADNLNLTFRMGFAVIGAMIALIVGPHILAVHAVLVAGYITAAVLCYFALRPVAGRFFAMGAVTLVTFNPFIGEWLANFTSDGLGLTLNLFALAFFLVGVRGRGRLSYLLLFAVFLALSGLTRPLMNLFLGPALLILLFVQASWRRRAVLMAVTLGTYALPVVAWMLVLHSQTGMWSVAGHSGSIFYATSDPELQVWRPEMYPDVTAAAEKRFDTNSPSPEQLDFIFRERTVENYLTHWEYHLKRFLPTAWAAARSAANCGFRDVSNPWEPGRAVRLWLLLALCIGGLVMALWRSNGIGALAVLLTGVGLVLRLDDMQAVLVLGACIFFALSLLWRKRDLAYPVLGWHFLVVMGTVYLVGAVWRPPGNEWHINGLGVRLSSQYIAATDIMLVYAIAAISQWTLPAWLLSRARFRRMAAPPTRLWRAVSHGFRTRVRRLSVPALLRSLLVPAPRLGNACMWVGRIVGLAAVVFFIIGGIRLSQKVYAFGPATAASPFPSIEPLAEPLTALLRERGYKGELIIEERWPRFNTWIYSEEHDPQAYRLFRGGLSPMISNIAGQRRSFDRFFLQRSREPFYIGGAYADLEIPQQLDKATWANRQGAWMVTRYPHDPPASHLAFYNLYPMVRAFVPLNEDGTGFDLDGIVWFDDVLNHSRLGGLGLLTHNAKETTDTPWPDFAGVRMVFPRVRWFTAEGSALSVEVDVTPARNQGEFSFDIELVSKERYASPATVEVQRLPPDSDRWQSVEQIAFEPNDLAMRLRRYYGIRSTIAGQFSINLAEQPADAVRIQITGLREKDKVRFLEMELRAPQLDLPQVRADAEQQAPEAPADDAPADEPATETAPAEPEPAAAS